MTVRRASEEADRRVRILKALASGDSLTEVAARFGISNHAVSEIRRRAHKDRQEVPDQDPFNDTRTNGMYAFVEDVGSK